MPSDQSRDEEQAKFTYFCRGKAFKKQIKTDGNQGEKQIKAISGNKQLDNTNVDLYEDKLLISNERMFIMKDSLN